ncbi:hypothetical protein [Streptomyces sp. MS2.AVA.5]|uniref:Uncharacterized protein n=1 Tax=Streptomyces achmelvichensis TaxID=3134111 RepID=A0ACC6PKR2_9ACTN
MRADRIDAAPVVAHVRQLMALRPELPVAAIARHAGIAASTLKTLLHDAQEDPGRSREVVATAGNKLLAVAPEDLPYQHRGYGGRSINAAPAMHHVQQLLTSHPRMSHAALARAAQVSPSTLAAALKDVANGRPRRIQEAAAQRLLALGTPARAVEPTRRRDTTDPAPVIAHIHNLQARYDGASLALIARAGGVNHSTLASALADHARNPGRRINAEVAAKILALTELPPPAFLRQPQVTDIGLLRRLRALCTTGWTLQHIAQSGDTTVKSLGQLLSSEISTPTIRSAGMTAWSLLAHRCGPSDVTRRRSLAKGWDPPLAWDERDIDEPHSTPQGTRRPGKPEPWSPQALRGELTFLTRLGLSHSQALVRLGLSSQRAQQLLTPPGTAPCAATVQTNDAEQTLAA